MQNNNNQNIKTLFKFPLVNLWYFVCTLIFILMRVTNIIDWSPIWILCPLWLPWVLALAFVIIPYILLGIINIIDYIFFRKRKL